MTASHRAASHRSGPLRGTATVPGDKSISHRALMLGSLAIGETRVTGLLEGEDVLRTAAAMRALGAEITRDGPGAWRVSGRGVGGLREPESVLDMGNSGTAARLLCGLLATHDFFSVMTGDDSLCRRPMARVITPLSATGAVFDSRAGGKMPLAIRGARDPLPLEYDIPVPSAQVKSAILLAGLNCRGDTVVTERVATRDHTETMLRHFGADVRTEGGRITLRGHPELFARDVAVPSDPSSAAFPIVAATLVPGSEVTLAGVAQNSGRTGLVLTLREMGAAIALSHARTEGGEPVADMIVTHGALRGVEVPEARAASMIDEFPILAVAAACARGETRMRGLAELRVKESDRLAATAAMIAAAGGTVRVEGDDLIVTGTGVPPLGGATIVTHMDHRLAMSALVLGLVTAEPVAVDDASFIDTSFPGFADLMRALGADIR